uniref:Candidate secreted effector n=1 Tax=Meloidogyne incognita TaxID=6306 RepID=A0A914KMZ7_MELIC
MFGMLSKKSLFLLPIILISIIIFIFHSLLIIQWITSWILLKEKIYDIDLFIIIIGFLLVEFIFILAIYLQIRCYRILQ